MPQLNAGRHGMGNPIKAVENALRMCSVESVDLMRMFLRVSLITANAGMWT